MCIPLIYKCIIIGCTFVRTLAFIVTPTRSFHFRTQRLFVVVVVVVLTLTHNTMQSVVAGQAPITLEWKKYLK